KGTSSQPRRRAARAGYSAVRSGDDVKMALSTSSGSKPFASRSARSSSSAASRIASRVFAVAVVAPRSPRRILAMALVDRVRLMVITDAALLKGRDPVTACRGARAVPADYWSVGPCFATATKLDAGPPLGPVGFAAVARLAPAGVPVIGVGGITAATAGSLARAGAAGVAVVAAVWRATDPSVAT